MLSNMLGSTLPRLCKHEKTHRAFGAYQRIVDQPDSAGDALLAASKPNSSVHKLGKGRASDNEDWEGISGRLMGQGRCRFPEQRQAAPGAQTTRPHLHKPCERDIGNTGNPFDPNQGEVHEEWQAKLILRDPATDISFWDEVPARVQP